VAGLFIFGYGFTTINSELREQQIHFGLKANGTLL
jgi:hypothetical protein